MAQSEPVKEDTLVGPIEESPFGIWPPNGDNWRFIAPPPWPLENNESLTIPYYRVANMLADYGYKIVKDEPR